MDDYESEHDLENQSDGKTFPPWNRYASRIADIILFPGVRSIGSYAFDGLAGDSAGRKGAWVSRLSGKKRAGKYVRLHSLVLPDTITRIGERAFRGCTQLESVCFPEHLKRIGDGAFAGCTQLQHLDLPEGLQYIGASAFAGCLPLDTVYIPESVKFVGKEAFAGCFLLREIDFGGTPPESEGVPFREVTAQAIYFDEFAEFWTDEEKEKWGTDLRWKILRLPSSAEELETICTEVQEMQSVQERTECAAGEGPEEPREHKYDDTNTFCWDPDAVVAWFDAPEEAEPVWRRRIRRADYCLFALSLLGAAGSMAADQLLSRSIILMILYPSLFLLCLSFAVMMLLED